MARLYFSPKPSPSAAVAAAASSLYCTLTTRVLLFLLGLLPLSLAAFAFALQWRGGGFPGRCGTARSSASVNVLGRSPFPTFPYFGRWNFTHPSNRSPKVCIVTSTSAGLDQVLPWIFFHKVIGVSTFFMFVEGNAASPGVSSVLESIPGVEVIYRTKALEEHQANSRIWNETWLEEFFFKPCNYELFVKQALNMEMAVVMAREASMDWIIHLDTDELIHPDGTKEYSLQELLSELPSDIDTVVFPNHESSVERHDIKEPFSEVSLFKRSYERISESTYYSYFLEAAHGNHDYFLTYANGKSAARIQDHLRGNGAHGWYNYMKEPNELTLDEATVLHYSYAKFSDLTSRHSRCGCKPTKEDVKRCFMLDFDRDAFIIASNATEEEMLLWYHEHVVWSNQTLKVRLLKNGILTRIYAPMVLSLKTAALCVAWRVYHCLNSSRKMLLMAVQQIKLLLAAL